MATASDSGVNYKIIPGRLKERFGFRLIADSKTVFTENVCRMHCHKAFASRIEHFVQGLNQFSDEILFK